MTPPTDSVIASSSPPRNAYGEFRFAREDSMMASHVSALVEANIIDSDQANRLSVPWHKKGVLNGGIWEKKYLDASKQETRFEVMDLGKARKIQARKDTEEKKFLEDWYAGVIDENGNPIINDTKLVEEEALASDTDSEIDIMPPPILKTAKKKKGVKTRAEQPKRTSSGRIVKPRFSSPPPSSLPTDTPLSSSPFKPSSLPDSSPPPPPRKPSKVITPSKPNPVLTTEPGMPDYIGIGYYQLIALCRDRDLTSGGSAKDVRARLIRDDIAIRDGMQRKELCRYSRIKGKRAYKHEALVLGEGSSSDKENAELGKGGKRKRDDDGDEDEHGGKKLKA